MLHTLQETAGKRAGGRDVTLLGDLLPDSSLAAFCGSKP